jgi:hypothetical protein
MPNLRVSIIRFVDEHQPGFVECEFTDAEGIVHTLTDKVPIFSFEDLWSDSVYPQPGFARCEVLSRSQDSQGRKLARVTIARPDSLESTTGLSEFVVLESQISDRVIWERQHHL